MRDGDFLLTDPHTRFEYLCSQRIAGDLSPSESQVLREHLEACPECQETIDCFDSFAVELTKGSTDRARTPLPQSLNAGIRSRLLKERIRLPEEPLDTEPIETAHGWKMLAAWFGIVLASVLAIMAFIYWIVPKQKDRTRNEQTAITEHATSQDQISSAQLSLQNQLQLKQKEFEAEVARQRQLLKAAEGKNASLQSQLDSFVSENSEIRERESDARNEIQRLHQERDGAAAEANRIRNESAVHLAEIADLRTRISSLNADLSRAHRLTAALTEVESLIKNRNVRLIRMGSVNDGTPEPAFGSAFYVPGQELIIFAYDLSTPDALTVHSFYVWGDKPGSREPVHALGKLNLEDQKDNRWVVRIADPDLFSRINEIFITMETKPDLQKPTGKPMLETSLTKPQP